MKYIAHVISHTHWDREWYMPYEQHHMRLVELIDTLLNVIDTDPNFKSFHMDGHTAPINDYLEVKPQNRERLMKALNDGKIKVGPWFILQDGYLTSSEANIRNMQYGDLDCQRYGNKEHVGYYPDTFGIYGQAAQILKKSGIDNMVFGRGVSTTGFNNEVSDSEFESKYSEMVVKAPNGDEVLGILFANWYSNANEMPTEREQAKVYWEQKLKDVKQYTPSKHLLFMNGCDHTPYTSDITEAIRLANELYEGEVTFIQSNFKDYIKGVKDDLDITSLSKIEGELRSQNTDGLYTLVNTASSRVYQKVQNAIVQDSFEKLAEPLSTMLRSKENYPHDQLEYGWKKLMLNHPHDSICGCSHDSVHRSVDMRFEDAHEVSKYIINEALDEFKLNVNNDLEGEVFTVINPLGSDITKTNTVEVEYKREEFGASFTNARLKMEGIDVSNLIITDTEGKQIDAKIEDLGAKFGYYLPKDKFRRAYYSRNLKITFTDNYSKFAWKSYVIKAGKSTYREINTTSNIMENSVLKVTINRDLSVDVLNKTNNVSFQSIMKIVDEGDIGNEYMFGNVKNDHFIDIQNYDSIEGYNSEIKSVRRIKAKLTVPKAAEDTLAEEQRIITEYYMRDSRRGTELVDIPVIVTLSLDKGDNKLDVSIDIDNKAKDHRIKVLFDFGSKSEYTYTDSIFEVVKRPTTVSKTWKNKNNDLHQSKFVSLINEQKGLTIANLGLAEYSTIDKQTLAITLLRSTGEMGDWGHFPTSESQALRKDNVKFSIYVHSEAEKNNVFDKARNIFIDLPSCKLEKNNGKLQLNDSFTNFDLETKASVSSLKRNRKNEAILRMFSNGEKAKIDIKDVKITNLLEVEQLGDKLEEIRENEIITVKLNNK